MAIRITFETVDVEGAESLTPIKILTYDSKGSGITAAGKQALLDLLEKVAYIDEDGQDYLDALEAALFPPANLVSITAVYTQTSSVFAGDDLDDLKDDLVVTAHYDDGTTEVVTTYTLSGELDENPSIITVSYGGKTTTFSVPVTVVSSISAVYTQSGTVYDTDTLDSLKADLVVTATYTDQSTATVVSTDYTLSGTLTAGTSTITVSYGGKTDTFTVAVNVGFYYTPARGVLSGQSYVSDTSSILTYFTESIDGDLLRLYAGKLGSGTQAGTYLFPDYVWATSVSLTLEFKIVNMTSLKSGNTTTPGVLAIGLPNNITKGETGWAMGSTGFARYNAASGDVRMRNNTGSGSSWLTNTISLDTLHTLQITVANGAQTITLDGTAIISSGSLYTSETYFSVPAIRLMQGSDNVTDFYIKSLEVAVE